MHEYSKKNKIIAFIDPILFINGMVFININTVIPYFLIRLSASNIHISLTNFLATLGSFLPSLFVARYVQRLKVKNRAFAKLLFTQRMIFLIFILLLPFFIKYLGNIFSIYIFILFWGIFNFFVGAYGPFYFSILDKILPYEERGRVVATGNAIGNIIALLSTYLLNIFLSKFSFPYNFMLIFLAGIIILLADAYLFYIIDEKEEETIENSLSFTEFIKYSFSFLSKDKNFRLAVTSFVFIFLSLTSISYFIVYTVRTFKVDSNVVSAFTFLSILANIVGGLSFGELSRRIGYKKVLILGTFLGAFGLFIVTLIRHLYAPFIGYTFVMLNFNANMTIGGFLLSALAKRENIPIYMAINNTISISLSSLMHILNGLIINFLGFQFLFGICLSFILIALVLLIRVKEYKRENSY
ncbi:MAG: hypothetical protein CBR30_05615 [Dictyoglomus sp. NZ13-RE01]|nr:MAG: hypothetical protein CBR30_05615 [Dictyoglomus sp. NZ13-RE01]